jgi:glucose-6-phosphate dehydrogenase assembly protein OpcA
MTTTELTGTNSSAIAAALLRARRSTGSPAMGMVMTLLVVSDEGDHYDALKAARRASRDHPARIIGVIGRTGRGPTILDAEVTIGASGEIVLLRLSGELVRHAESVVLPLLLPDSPVVVWWPVNAPDEIAADPLGRLANRRITDVAGLSRGRLSALLVQAEHYQAGNSDLSWTRLTPWRALLAAALDQYPASVGGANVAAERGNPSADLLSAWLTDRLGVEVTRSNSKGPGITEVTLSTGGGDVEINRPDGLLARFTTPNSPDRPVALKRRELHELLDEELRRLDPDEVYEDTLRALLRRERPGKRAERPASAASRSKRSDSSKVRASASSAGTRKRTTGTTGKTGSAKSGNAAKSGKAAKAAKAAKTARSGKAEKSTKRAKSARKASS